jgi:hypothetical protein
MALCHAYQTPESDETGATENPTSDGVTLAEAGEIPGKNVRVSVKALGYADDLSAIGKSNPETRKYAQAMVTMLGCLNIRVQGSKCIYLRPAIAAHNDETCVITSELLETMGITSSNEEPPTMSTINKHSLLNKKVIIHHRKNTEKPTLEGIITEIDQKGSCTITLPNKTSLTMDLKEAIRALIRKTRADIILTAMDWNGGLKHMECTRVEPLANPEGKTAEERGATRYLGAYMSFLG